MVSNVRKKIVLITSGQPSLNPRLVKEADSLSNEGYEVIVLYAYWNDWGTRQDEKLLSQKKWKAIRQGGDPIKNKFTYFISRIIHNFCRLIIQKTGSFKYFSKFAIARGSYFLIRAAKNNIADLYIAHNLGALPAAIIAAKKYGKPCGFDAEDFHRQELNDDLNSYHHKIVSFLEDQYLPVVDYLTTSSPLTSQQYALLYKKEVNTILNVFPKTNGVYIKNNESESLKLFWFSQTIGPNRGLETIVEAMCLSNESIELHLLGSINIDYRNSLELICKNNNVAFDRLKFYSPINPDEIIVFGSQFDIGLASETDVCLNRRISLTNKLFTYIQSGLVVVASNTEAQTAFINSNSGIGQVYKNAAELATILNLYQQNRDLLFESRKHSRMLGESQLNWELESQNFLGLVQNVLSR